ADHDRDHLLQLDLERHDVDRSGQRQLVDVHGYERVEHDVRVADVHRRDVRRDIDEHCAYDDHGSDYERSHDDDGFDHYRVVDDRRADDGRDHDRLDDDGADDPD